MLTTERGWSGEAYEQLVDRLLAGALLEGREAARHTRQAPDAPIEDAERTQRRSPSPRATRKPSRGA
jgi:hypothetical protein